MITLVRSTNRELEEQTWLGSALALCIGNRSQRSEWQYLKWCPRRQQLGDSACQLVEVSQAVCHGLRGRRQLRPRDLFDEEGQLYQQTVALISGKGKEMHPIQNLRVFAWGGHIWERNAGAEGTTPGGDTEVTPEFWVPRAPNQLRLAGRGLPPTIPDLRAAFDWDSVVFTRQQLHRGETG